MISFAELKPENGTVIGEIACGHEGDIGRMRQLIDAVSEGGAPLIKFQIFTTEERAIEGRKEWEIFDRLTLDESHWEAAVAYAREKDLGVISDVFGADSFSLAQKLGVDGYKIHSEDLLNSYFIKEVAETGKILIIGVGGARRSELSSLLEFLSRRSLLEQVILMTGVQTFPTPLVAHSVREVGDLIAKYSHYGVKIGFSDHVEGDREEAHVLPLMALAQGACIIEKHITVSRADKWIDYQSALDKGEFKKFVKRVGELCSTLRPLGYMNDYERQYRGMFKKSPVAAADLTAGATLQAADIRFVKDADNPIPIASLDLEGRPVAVPMSAGTPFSPIRLDNKISGIIVARCTSSRLPNKALIEIAGRESIALVIDRIKRCRYLDSVILATSTDPSDDILVKIAAREGILSYRGPLDDVSRRYYEAAVEYDLDHFARVTGDALLCDDVMLDRAVESHLQSGCDVTFMGNMPFGTSKEIVSVDAVKTIMEHAVVPSNTEYLEYYLENDRYFNVNYVASDYEFDERLRITLDYEEDLRFMEAIFSHFKNSKPDFTLGDALAWIGDNPDIVEISAHMRQKFYADELNVDLNI